MEALNEPSAPAEYLFRRLPRSLRHNKPDKNLGNIVQKYYACGSRLFADFFSFPRLPMFPCHPSPYCSLLMAARATLIRYGQCLRLLKSGCFRPLFSCLGSVAIASVLLVNATPINAAESGVLSFDLGADASGLRDAVDVEAANIFDARGIAVSSADGMSGAIAQSPISQSPISQSPRDVAQTMNWAENDELDNDELEDDSWLDEIVTTQASVAPREDAVAQQESRQGGTLSLGLAEPALVASAPFALATSVRRLVTPHQSLGEVVASEQGYSSDAAEESPGSFNDVIPEAWWHQGERSPIAVAIGSAEGTRYADGGKTDAYYWHADPGNGADNFGTFSYQHLPDSLTQGVRHQPTTAAKREVAAQNQLPEISDRAQIKRLRGFYEQLQQQAAERGIVMGQLEVLNALDLANQSEAAALWKEGYVDRLVELRQYGGDLEEQILQARAWSYWNPERKDWDAPGLGNTYETIRRDQLRRMEAIKQAMQRYEPAAMGQAAGEGAESKIARRAASAPHLAPEAQLREQARVALASDVLASEIILFDLL